ncbi:MAG: response regulator [Chitinispirillales bacterium]|jgi:PleD family two-component response regulator|nr:response regulator [Chitinispirillales bacterium]
MENVGKKIIIVDSVEHTLITLKDELAKHYEVSSALSAAKMFESLEHVTPDSILLSVDMPDINGYEAIQKLKADSRYAHIPVILLSDESGQEHIDKGLELGAADYICKPFSVHELVESIDRQINPDAYKKIEGSARKKIIYVDDVNYSLISVKNRLKNRYEIYPAQSASKMFLILERVTPDLILLDIDMPVVNGYETIKLLKTDPRYKSIPVIFLTSKTSKEHVVKAMNLGAAGYVIKPFSDSELTERIEHQINLQAPEQK